MTTWANELRLHISNVLNTVVTDTHYLKLFVTMSKLVWQLYNDNMISIEVANMLLDQHYNRVNKT